MQSNTIAASKTWNINILKNACDAYMFLIDIQSSMTDTIPVLIKAVKTIIYE